MQHDLIEDIAKAIDDALPESDKFTLAPSQIRRAARAAHSVMSARMAELEEALRAAIDMIDDAARDGGYSLSELAGLRAALAPHPKGTDQ